MELKSIKLVGFKSFADSTSIPISSNLTAIVGPNGCGKSNVVDAVRWVIGESSAKQLRGQSMNDVIFNGTTNRKPVGKASVELLFNNHDGRIGGEFASFGDISVKREVERDGQSSYFLNGTACRRRDILGVFLGTGLGSRSYAIIEQGMISRLIESKPEEMRTHLEEAAGISKYKDRRRDTENRMRRTEENLDRVNDIREELATQLRRLKRQANAAERYKVLKDEETALQAQIKALQWQELQNMLDQQSINVNQHRTQYDERLSQQRSVERQLEELRSSEYELRENESSIQQLYYRHATEIARIEQQIKHNQEQTSSWQMELSEADTLFEDLTTGSEEQRFQIEELVNELSNIEPHSQEIQSQAEEAQARLLEAEEAMQLAQDEWENFRSQNADNTRAYDVARNSVSHISSQEARVSSRLAQLKVSLDTDEIEQLRSEIDPLSIETDNANYELECAQEQLDQLTSTIQQKRSENQALKAEAQQDRKRYHQEQSKLASLEALQQAALSDELTQEWLQNQNLDQLDRLGDQIAVDEGWEYALETVLGQQFQALCVSSIANIKSHLESFTQGQLTFVDNRPTGGSQYSPSIDAPLIIDKIKSNQCLDTWLTGIYAVDHLEEALKLQSSLASQESIVTRDGMWLGPNWLRIKKSSADHTSVLQRKQQIDELQQSLSLLERNCHDQEASLEASEFNLSEIESQRDMLLASIKDKNDTLSHLKTTLGTKQSRCQQLEQQLQQTHHEIDELALQQQQLQEEKTRTDDSIVRLEAALQEQESTKSLLQERKEQCQQTLMEARSQAQAAKQRADELGIRVTANENQLNLLRQTVSRAQRQIEQLQERRDSLKLNLAETDSPLSNLSEQLQKELTQHVEVEQSLKEAQSQLRELTTKMGQLNDERDSLIKSVSLFKDELQALHMKEQEYKVRQDTIVEQLQVTDTDLHDTIATLPEDAGLSAWQNQLDNVSQRISKLGPINLGAIEEFEVLTERKTYLDTQHSDLQEALDSLDGAIKKIDRETRGRFKEVYEKVNENFQTYFPKIFGGGRAYLELEENDMLTSGVMVKAQPPGKRNTTIHMLSGGEKALTAIALVFAMFKINPAPFCILDEVDAPLDDVNVGRYCSLIKEMSDTTQFLVISHNKVTIALANQLMGVTMHEAGVSRIVSVDVEKAIEMVDA